MSEAYAGQSAETGSAPADSGTSSYAEPGESEAPAAANDNTPQAANDNTARAANENAAPASGDVAAPTLEAGEGVPAEPANDNALGADASQVTTADSSAAGSRISEMKNGELSGNFDKVAVKKGGGAGGDGGDGEDGDGGDGKDGDGDKDKEKGAEQPVLTYDPGQTDVLVGKDVLPNATQENETKAEGDNTEESLDKKPTETKADGANAEIKEDSTDEGDQEALSDETDGNGDTKPAADGTNSSSGAAKMSPAMQKALDQYTQSKADPTAATSRASFSPGQEASAVRTKAQSKPNGPRR